MTQGSTGRRDGGQRHDKPHHDGEWRSASLQEECPMIIDLRTYTMVPGRLKAFLTLYEAEALPIQMRHLGQLIGYFTTEVGTQNQVVHLWGYASMADREARRNAMEADPEWIAYRQKSAAAGNVQHQENKLLKSVSFSPL
jgi:NIPSNAP